MSCVGESALVADDDDAAASLVERRWFAASAAVNAMQGECDVLREVMDLAEEAWRHARAHLAELKSLRDGLNQQLADLAGEQQAHPARSRGAVGGLAAA